MSTTWERWDKAMSERHVMSDGKYCDYCPGRLEPEEAWLVCGSCGAEYYADGQPMKEQTPTQEPT